MKRLDRKPLDLHVFVCHGSRCTREGAPALRSALRRALRRTGLRVRISRSGCQGLCKRGPVVFTEYPKPRVWGRVGLDDVPRLARRLSDKLIARLAGRAAAADTSTRATGPTE